MNLANLLNVVVTGKVVLVRVDLNLPMINGEIADTTRIRAISDTVNYLRSRGAKILLMSHLGRPNGIDPKYSLSQVLSSCEAMFNDSVRFVEEINLQNLYKTISELKEGQIALLENLRFYKEEEANDLSFARMIASVANIYVNEAFSCSHRRHASICGVTNFVRSVAGFKLLKELEVLLPLTEDSSRNLVGIVGGNKFSTKIKALQFLISKRCKALYLGGGVANTILHKKGYCVGKSVIEKDLGEEVDNLLELAKLHNCSIFLPEKVVVFQNGLSKEKNITDVDAEDNILDVGEDLSFLLESNLTNGDVVLMNGSLGMYEKSPFDKGTKNIIKIVTAKKNITKIAGGGDMVSCIAKAKQLDNFDLISTGGGAFLDLISGLELPGLTALENSNKRFADLT